ncbi:MAG: FAD-dependent thymidylate synthase [delta proteobacterium ML8_F1]|nr:MAG: FAD-dependent thymidylate synthase [delta proteobacterium ML8_F1]
MKVELIAHTLQPENIVAAAAKLCYSKVDASEIMMNLDPAKVEGFVTHLMTLGHESPIEHVSFTFAIEGVSRVLSHQLVRHRLASYSQQSQRYVRLDQFQYVIPPAIAGDPEAKRLFIETMERDQAAYDTLTEILRQKAYEGYLAEGQAHKDALRNAEKKAIEDARYVFPNAAETKIVVTMNARSLKNFFAQRTCLRAQWEIRELATEMLRIVKKIAPVIFKDAGPGCISGPCPEGVMTCGKIVEVREKFKNL